MVELVVAWPVVQPQRHQARHRRARRSVRPRSAPATARPPSAAPPAPRRWSPAPRRCCSRRTRTRTPAQIKAMLMNTAETQRLTPIRRRCRASWRRSPASAAAKCGSTKAILATRAWDRGRRAGSLSFGYAEACDRRARRKLRRELPPCRAASASLALPLRRRRGSRRGAIDTPVGVGARAAHETSKSGCMIDSSKLPAWTLNGGPQGGNGRR